MKSVMKIQACYLHICDMELDLLLLIKDLETARRAQKIVPVTNEVTMDRKCKEARPSTTNLESAMKGIKD